MSGPSAAVDEVHAHTERYLAAWTDDFPDLVERFHARDAVLSPPDGTAIEGRDAIASEFLRPNVARIRGMRPTGDAQVELAGLVQLRGVTPEPDPIELRTQDGTRLFEMYDRAGAAVVGGDPDRSGPRREDWYEPRFRRTGAKIEVPTLPFEIESATPRWEVEWEFRIGLADWVTSDPQSFPDSLSRQYFQRLAADTELQAEVQAFYQDAFAPAWRSAEHAFLHAFTDHLVVRLEGQDPRSYYQYRDAPDLIYPHIREFLDELRARTAARDAVY